MPITPAQQRAKKKYDNKHYTAIQVKPSKEEAALIKSYAESRGESVTRFICRAVMTQIEIDKNAENMGDNNEK